MKIEVGEEGTDNEIRESGLDPAKVSDVGDLDDDGRPKRTGTLSLSLSLSLPPPCVTVPFHFCIFHLLHTKVFVFYSCFCTKIFILLLLETIKKMITINHFLFSKFYLHKMNGIKN